MKKNRYIIVLAVFLLLPLASGAQAKWWIFGQSKEAISVGSLFINQMSFDDSGAKVTLYRDMLPDNTIILKGRASAGLGKVGAVRVTIDNKVSWQDAKLSEGGAFQYSFPAQLGQTYQIYIEVSDTAGKTNSVADTYREVTVSDHDFRSMVIATMDKLVAAYINQDSPGFMALVSGDFAGDATNLALALKNDFRFFNNVSLSYTLNTITTDARGIVDVSLNYSRTVTSRKTSTTLSDRGTTEFGFKLADNGIKLYLMKIPLIFGLSDASSVATGVVNTGANNPTLVVDQQGNVSTPPLPQAITDQQTGQIGSACSAVSGSITLHSFSFTPTMSYQSFVFASQSVDSENTGPSSGLNGDMGFRCQGAGGNSPIFLFGHGGAKWKYLGSGSISSFSPPVPDQSTYSSGDDWYPPPSGFGLYALYLHTGKYAVISLNSDSCSAGVGTAQFNYIYQPDGTTNVCKP